MTGSSKFQPGQSGNPKGRPKGSVDKKTEIWKEVGEKLETVGATKFWNELNKMKGEKYLKYYFGALEYFKPKLQRKEIEETRTELKIILEKKTIDRTLSAEDAQIVETKLIQDGK